MKARCCHVDIVRPPVLVLLAALLALLLTPGIAGARTLEPPVFGSPGTGPMRDTTLAATPRATTAAAKRYRTADGNQILVDVSPAYRADDGAIRQYVDFLGRVPHGSELSKLKLYIATPDEVEQLCGGSEGTLACYAPRTDLMIAPGEQPPGVNLSVGYIVAHEYGHHVAAHRDNSPFPAEDYGPKYWASQELVCAGVKAKRFFPGDEGANYTSNPGEAWAETYAHLVYPDVEWMFNPLLAPTTASLAAARRDVLDPWKGRRTKTFRGRLAAGEKAKDVRFRMTLDGSLSVALSGPKTANFDIGLIADGREQGTSRAPGSRDALSFKVACRTKTTGGQVTVRVRRRSGRGPFTVTAKYPG
jgi:hypothetical protein